MTLSYDDTKVLIDLVLGVPKEDARRLLNQELRRRSWSEPEFYAGVVKHGRGMAYTGDQWFEFLSKIPNGILRDDSGLLEKLSERQRAELPAATFSSGPNVQPGTAKKE